jgi:hypothetical protein
MQILDPILDPERDFFLHFVFVFLFFEQSKQHIVRHSVVFHLSIKQNIRARVNPGLSIDCLCQPVDLSIRGQIIDLSAVESKKNL